MPFRTKMESYSEDVAEGEAEEEKVKEVREEEGQVQEKWKLVPRKWHDQEKIPEKIPNKKQYADQKKEKRMKLSVALSRREIEEDMFAITGSRLSRKPKKRPKKLQDMVDHLSPAFSLHTITPSLYNSRG